MARHDNVRISSAILRRATPRVGGSSHSWGLKAVKEIKTGNPYCYRYRLADDLLQASIKRSGIMIPVLVTEGNRPTVISGHRRLHAARVLKFKNVPVAAVKKMTPREAFLLNLVSNWKHRCSELDRAKALGIAARKFVFSEADRVHLILPLLGLPEDKSLIAFYQKIDQFPRPLKALVEEGLLPLRSMSFLFKFSERDQTCFARRICSRARLTSSQLLQAGEWLADLIKGSGKDLESILKENMLPEELNVRGMDLRAKGDRFFAAIKRLRFPGYSQYAKAFEERRGDALRGAKEFRLEPVQGFEEPGFELHARVRNPEDLDRLLLRISEKRSALNSLFEIAL